MPIAKITNLSSEFIPATGGSLRSRTVSSTAIDWMNFTPSGNTKYLVWSLSGGDVRITIDGSDPTTTAGFLIADGSTGVWNVTWADAVRAIRTGATDGVFQVLEADTKGGY